MPRTQSSVEDRLEQLERTETFPSPPDFAEHAQVPRSDVRIVEDNVVVIATADADLRTGAAVALEHVVVPRENLDPDHLLHWIASMKRLASPRALSYATPRMVSFDTKASFERS